MSHRYSQRRSQLLDKIIERKLKWENEKSLQDENRVPEGFQSFKIAMEHGVCGGFLWDKLQQDIYKSIIFFETDLNRAAKRDFQCGKMPVDCERDLGRKPHGNQRILPQKGHGV